MARENTFADELCKVGEGDDLVGEGGDDDVQSGRGEKSLMRVIAIGQLCWRGSSLKEDDESDQFYLGSILPPISISSYLQSSKTNLSDVTINLVSEPKTDQQNFQVPFLVSIFNFNLQNDFI